ncbi:Fimbrial assembly family protein [Desulfotomaculum nigrificans CO-1-SRB]|uniref:Fimbrial assembly family protein n=1 Tax=Desulfotomaculum nigrificans (strain DSM 14880 / VKM B-2319 / CO-1-SRB) TaxID=868595 RepID=F6BA40_DESCC|nr:type 4a pilus biogenesis protein PilO [Desulfotomaculum nigrificans]AEF95009.1 Fimbrial assembly family protein [Desulfotomaculum nigrificans CO-1-SRB]
MIKLEVTPRDKKILSIFIPVLLLGLLVWFFLWPRFNEYRTNQARIAHIKDSIQQLRQGNSRLDDELKSLAQTRAKLSEVNKRFSTDMQDGLFIVSLSRKLKAEHVNLTLFRPLDVQEKESYYILPVEMELTGDYNRLIAVIDFLENQANLTELREISFEALTPQGESSSENPFITQSILAQGDVTAKFILMIFSQHSPQGKLYLEDIKNWRFGRENPFTEMANPRPIPPNMGPSTGLYPPLPITN